MKTTKLNLGAIFIYLGLTCFSSGLLASDEINMKTIDLDPETELLKIHVSLGGYSGCSSAGPTPMIYNIEENTITIAVVPFGLFGDNDDSGDIIIETPIAHCLAYFEAYGTVFVEVTSDLQAFDQLHIVAPKDRRFDNPGENITVNQLQYLIH